MAQTTSSPTVQPAAAGLPQPVTAAQLGPTDSAIFAGEEDNIPDGALVQPGQPFSKVWVLQNAGATAWDSRYRLTLVGGSPLGATAAVQAPATPPGGQARFTVNFVAPATRGRLKSTWQLINPAGQAFGHQVWAEVQVVAQPSGAQTFPPPPDQLLPTPPGAAVIVQAVVNTWNRYGGLILDEAQRLDIDPGVAVAVLVAESTGDGFENGRLKIRFENQIFHHYWGRHNPERFAQHFAFSTRPDESWKEHQWRADPNGPWLPCHKSQDGEWEVFEFARQLDERAAMFAISMGAPQIMGFNHATVGYATVQAMFDDFANDARSQLTSFFRFMEVNRLVQAVRDRDFVTFARAYNGPGQAEVYGGLIRDYAAAFASVRPGAARGLVQPSTPLPAPAQPRPRGRSLKEDDPELYAAWSKHIQQGFANNQTMFSQVLEAFLNPYWTTVWMYRVLFAVGVGAFVLAGFLAVFQANLSAAALFGGLSVVAFLGFFVSRPLQALEENLQFITWLGIIYNSYWTRLVQAQDPATFERIIQDATGDAIQQIKELEAKHAERGTNRPGLR